MPYHSFHFANGITLNSCYYPEFIQQRLAQFYTDEIKATVKEIEECRKSALFSFEAKSHLNALHEYLDMLCKLEANIKGQEVPHNDPEQECEDSRKEEVYL